MNQAAIDRGMVFSLGLALWLGAFSSAAPSELHTDPVAGEQPTAEAAQWIPLATTEPGPTGDGPGTDLAHLMQWIDEPAILGLGEDPHGTHTLHRLSHRIFEYLVEHEGFETFALEVDQAHASLLDDYVQGRRDDLEELVAGGWWGQKIFYDEALVELLRWMRQHNRGADHPVHVAGFDLKLPHLAAERLLEALAVLDPRSVPRARQLVARALAPGAFGLFPNVQGFTGAVRIPLPAERTQGPVHLELRIRSEGVTYGTAGFWLRPETGGAATVMTLASTDLKPEATPRTLEIELPEATEALELAVFHRGDGTVWFEDPALVLGARRVPLTGAFDSIEPRPLMMPALQRMDYRGELVGRNTLEVRADPVLGDSLEAARALEALVDQALRNRGAEDPPESSAAWTRQLSRLITEAVEWRTLAEPNRDVFLAENLLWLHRQASPSDRILALGHRSHTERRPGKMGGLVARELGEAYKTVSMIAGSGSYRYFGEVSKITDKAPLELLEVGPGTPSDLRTRLGHLHPGSFVLRTSTPVADSTGQTVLEEAWRPDAILFVKTVEPLRPAP